MSQPAKAQEPSMEEILASIRRIIADDDPAKAAPPAAAAEPAPKPAPAVVATPRPAPPPPRVAPMAVAATKQDEIDAVLAEIEPELPKPIVSPKPAPVAAPPASEVLDLTEAMAATTFRKIDGASDVVFAERGSDAPEPPRPAPAQAPTAGIADNGLISVATRAAVDNAFNSLANTVLGNNARTLEDLVKEMLRPMLKSWLDDNLPGLVERIVRAEIERVSRGR